MKPRSFKERTKKPDKTYLICAHCGTRYEASDLERYSNLILKHKPACSFECNKALGQVKK